jgi:hypothetical protein
MYDLPLTGGCLCGDLRYAVSAVPTWVGHCHCSLCRRAGGALYVTWFTVPAHALAMVQGSPTRFASSERAVRQHCARCGTQLTFQLNAKPEVFDVTVGSLDRPGVLMPQEHLFWKSRVPGLEMPDGLHRREDA